VKREAGAFDLPWRFDGHGSAGCCLGLYAGRTTERGWVPSGRLSFWIALVSVGAVVCRAKRFFFNGQFAIFRFHRRLTAANLVRFIVCRLCWLNSFLLTLYMQQVAYSALETRLRATRSGFAADAGGTLSQGGLKYSVRVVPINLAIVMRWSLFVLSRVETNSSYLTILLPGTILFGIGLTGSGVP